MYCNRLHAWWSTQSRFATLFSSLIACRWVDFRLYYGSDFKKVNEYDQEIPQSQTADNPVARQGRAAQPSRDTRKTN